MRGLSGMRSAGKAKEAAGADYVPLLPEGVRNTSVYLSGCIFKKQWEKEKREEGQGWNQTHEYAMIHSFAFRTM